MSHIVALQLPDKWYRDQRIAVYAQESRFEFFFQRAQRVLKDHFRPGHNCRHVFVFSSQRPDFVHRNQVLA